MNYINTLNDEVKNYFNILTDYFPIWLLDYINTFEMQRISKISLSCGTDYSKCFDVKYFYSNLDHSVGVALIIWNFTHDKKQTLAGLFHDIANPAFKHCIDFMNGDAECQESTEEKTVEIIKSSKEIMDLLKRDNISLDSVCDYKMYPIADNNTPMLSADRFEYTFSSGLTFYRVWELNKIKEIYNDIIIGKNELNNDELAFKTLNIGEEYINTISKLWPEWVSDKDRTVMQFIADMCKSMNAIGLLSIDDLYKLSEQEIIDKIFNSNDLYLISSFKKFVNATKVYKGYASDKYSVNVKTKVRYINPLIKTNGGYERISKLSSISNSKIEEYLNIPKEGWTHFDFDFKPYVKKM